MTTIFAGFDPITTIPEIIAAGGRARPELPLGGAK
jgi:hypothetical protein